MISEYWRNYKREQRRDPDYRRRENQRRRILYEQRKKEAEATRRLITIHLAILKIKRFSDMGDITDRARAIRLSRRVVEICEKMLACQELTPEQQRRVESILDDNLNKLAMLESRILLEQL